MIHQATVASLRNLVIQHQFKTVILLLGDDVPSSLGCPYDTIVLDHPSISHGFLFVVTPSVQIFSIEKKFPAILALTFGEAIDLAFLCKACRMEACLGQKGGAQKAWAMTWLILFIID